MRKREKAAVMNGPVLYGYNYMYKGIWIRRHCCFIKTLYHISLKEMIKCINWSMNFFRIEEWEDRYNRRIALKGNYVESWNIFLYFLSVFGWFTKKKIIRKFQVKKIKKVKIETIEIVELKHLQPEQVATVWKF